MTEVTEKYPARDATPRDGVKVRNCLRCRERFRSEWAGERICPRCKGSTAWRSGAPFAPQPSGGRR